MSAPSSPDVLGAIVAATRRIVEEQRRLEPLAKLERRAARRVPRGDAFEAALRATGGFNVIAECKRRSPSRGVLRQDYDPVAIASAYARCGAAAISVLTEPCFFDGALAHLEAVRDAVGVPLLRKDFTVDPYQLHEARASGADAILLIVAALSPAEIAALAGEARALGLATLVEVHNEAELAIAVESGATLIGVNNRDLRTLQVSVAASERLIAQMPRDRIAVAESGLRTHEDLVRLSAMGYGAFLVGERFMASDDPGAALQQLIAGSDGPSTEARA
ncbi:MAG: indole-3-glycerol phosphate synthase TrpC [Vicinamibacterales bacterium]